MFICTSGEDSKLSGTVNNLNRCTKKGYRVSRLS